MTLEKFLDLTNIDRKTKNIWKLETEEQQPPKKQIKTANDTDTLLIVWILVLTDNCEVDGGIFAQKLSNVFKI